MTTNYAPERLRNLVGVALVKASSDKHFVEQVRDSIDEALAAERRATVERIRHTILFQRNRLNKPPESLRVTELLAILDEEAAR